MMLSVRAVILLASFAACGFPPPADVPADPTSPGGCQGDGECSGSTPFCVDSACVVCRTSSTCPHTTPVCDDVTRDCRGCAHDNECNSGACDLAEGTCVEPGAILYASPAGTIANTCTRLSPCSLAKAASSVDASHVYVVMQPGTYTTGAAFDGKHAIVAGAGATLDLTESATQPLAVFGGSRVEIRNLNLSEHVQSGSEGTVIYCSSTSEDALRAELVVDGVRATTRAVPAISSGGDITMTIRNSVIDGQVVVFGRLVADRSQFLNEGLFVIGTAEIANSIFASTKTALSITSPDIVATSHITNNTFIGGNIICEPQMYHTRQFSGNIIYKYNSIQTNRDCLFDYNLVMPASVLMSAGDGPNLTGDPRFVNENSGNYHLGADSPAIEAADPDSGTGHDYDGVPRPQGNHFDIGAFEYVP